MQSEKRTIALATTPSPPPSLAHFLAPAHSSQAYILAHTALLLTRTSIAFFWPPFCTLSQCTRFPTIMKNHLPLPNRPIASRCTKTGITAIPSHVASSQLSPATLILSRIPTPRTTADRESSLFHTQTRDTRCTSKMSGEYHFHLSVFLTLYSAAPLQPPKGNSIDRISKGTSRVREMTQTTSESGEVCDLVIPSRSKARSYGKSASL